MVAANGCDVVAGSDREGVIAETAPLEVFLFGPMRLRRDGQYLELPPELPRKALALLALNGGCMHQDALIERLWPDSSVGPGRNQLRTLLNRLRGAGIAVERQSRLVVLRHGVDCDVEAFAELSSRALAGLDEPIEGRRLAHAAQRLWVGPPLEAWRYEPWAAGVRERLFRLRAGLWQTLVGEAPGADAASSA